MKQRRDRSKKPSEEDIQVASYLRHLRSQARVNQDTLAGHLGISPQQLSKYENGKNRMTAGKLVKAMSFLVPEVGSIEDPLAATTYTRHLSGLSEAATAYYPGIDERGVMKDDWKKVEAILARLKAKMLE